MATVKKLIGKLPVYKGDWVAGSYSMLNQVTYLGSTFQSKIDNNTSQPATVVNNALQVNANWSVVSNGTAAYLAGERLTKTENDLAQLEQILFANNGFVDYRNGLIASQEDDSYKHTNKYAISNGLVITVKNPANFGNCKCINYYDVNGEFISSGVYGADTEIKYFPERAVFFNLNYRINTEATINTPTVLSSSFVKQIPVAQTLGFAHKETGEILKSVSIKNTSYISAPISESYIYIYNPENIGNCVALVYYDKDRKFISSESRSGNIVLSATDIPEGAAYVICNTRAEGGSVFVSGYDFSYLENNKTNQLCLYALQEKYKRYNYLCKYTNLTIPCLGTQYIYAKINNEKLLLKTNVESFVVNGYLEYFYAFNFVPSDRLLKDIDLNNGFKAEYLNNVANKYISTQLPNMICTSGISQTGNTLQYTEGNTGIGAYYNFNLETANGYVFIKIKGSTTSAKGCEVFNANFGTDRSSLIEGSGNFEWAGFLKSSYIGFTTTDKSAGSVTITSIEIYTPSYTSAINMSCIDPLYINDLASKKTIEKKADLYSRIIGDKNNTIIPFNDGITVDFKINPNFDICDSLLNGRETTLLSLYSNGDPFYESRLSISHKACIAGECFDQQETSIANKPIWQLYPLFDGITLMSIRIESPVDSDANEEMIVDKSGIHFTSKGSFNFSEYPTIKSICEAINNSGKGIVAQLDADYDSSSTSIREGKWKLCKYVTPDSTSIRTITSFPCYLVDKKTKPVPARIVISKNATTGRGVFKIYINKILVYSGYINQRDYFTTFFTIAPSSNVSDVRIREGIFEPFKLHVNMGHWMVDCKEYDKQVIPESELDGYRKSSYTMSSSRYIRINKYLLEKGIEFISLQELEYIATSLDEDSWRDNRKYFLWSWDDSSIDWFTIPKVRDFVLGNNISNLTPCDNTHFTDLNNKQDVKKCYDFTRGFKVDFCYHAYTHHGYSRMVYTEAMTQINSMKQMMYDLGIPSRSWIHAYNNTSPSNARLSYNLGIMMVIGASVSDSLNYGIRRSYWDDEAILFADIVNEIDNSFGD